MASQQDEDAYRLPEGFQRIAYDADTTQYTFRDSDGSYYQSAPGQEYGVLTPIEDPATILNKSRPDAFASNSNPRVVDLTVNVNAPATTFQDFLPAELITSPSSIKSPKSPEGSSKGQFASAVRRATLPKMQGVVQNLKRSMTSARKGPAGSASGGGKKRRADSDDSAQRHLLRQDSVASSKLDRIPSIASATSNVSSASRTTVTAPRSR